LAIKWKMACIYLRLFRAAAALAAVGLSPLDNLD